MTERRTATVLVQALNPRPGVALELADLIEGAGIDDVEPVIGAFDVLVTVSGPTEDAVAAAAVRISELDAVGSTLTLAHVRPSS